MPNTRPRLTFNEEGVCSACSWAEEKKSNILWDLRQKELETFCLHHKKRNASQFNCILPVSGGKDSSYVAYMMRDKMGMKPLAITLAPPLPFEIGKQNLENFINSGFDHIRITVNPKISGQITKKAFFEQGQPLMSWIMSVQTAIFRLAVLFDISFIMFGEEGEAEYGGSGELKNKACYDLDTSIKLYLSGNDPNYYLGEFSKEDTYWLQYPDEADFRRLNPDIAHWSYFENWDSYRNYMVAKEKFGLQEQTERCLGTYNNFAQTDTTLYDLHTYLMYLKFGFGRCSQDVGIDIRRGALSRKQGLALVKRYDGEYPEPYISGYLEYMNISINEFNEALDRHVNKALFEKVNGRWKPTFEQQ